jgi:hypothetical protein
MLSVTMLSVVMLNVVMLSVAAPRLAPWICAVKRFTAVSNFLVASTSYFNPSQIFAAKADG